jgi:hypothetical protein
MLPFYNATCLCSYSSCPQGIFSFKDKNRKGGKNVIETATRRAGNVVLLFASNPWGDSVRAFTVGRTIRYGM